MTFDSIRNATLALCATGLLVSTWPIDDTRAQTAPTSASRPAPTALPGDFSARPLPPPPPRFDILAAFPDDPTESKKCTTIASCDDLIAQCYADADKPGDWACHEENSEGQCTTGTCIEP